MNKLKLLLFSLITFASFESLLAVSQFLQPPGGQTPPPPPGTFVIVAGAGPANFFWAFAPHLALIGWFGVGLTVYLGRSGRWIFRKRGFSNEIYNLMIKMRGGNSRIALLRSLDSPHHRFDLAEITGMDWKEVDREVTILEDYGLVKIYAQSGAVKLYQMTEQGKMLIRLMDDLERSKGTHNDAP